MVEAVNKIVWTKRSLRNLKKIFDYIGKELSKSATKVTHDIARGMEKAQSNPLIYNADKYKTNNNGNYRAFEKHHYRVVYKIEKTLYLFSELDILNKSHWSIKTLDELNLPLLIFIYLSETVLSQKHIKSISRSYALISLLFFLICAIKYLRTN